MTKTLSVTTLPILPENQNKTKMSRAKNSAYDTKESSSSNRSTISPATTEEEFINQGYTRWQQLRSEWRSSNYNGVKQPGSPMRRRPEPSALEVEEILERIFNSKDGNMTLPEPVPLGKMIEILLDVWEADGLYD